VTIIAQAPSIVFSAILVVLAGLIWRANRTDCVNRSFATFAFFLACWVFGVSQLQAGGDLEFWGRFTFASAAVIPASFLAFTEWYPNPSGWVPRWVLIATALTGITFAALSLATPLIVWDVQIGPQGLQRNTGSLHGLFIGYFVSAWLMALVILFRKWRAARGRSRAQLQYLGVGILLSIALGIGTNLLLPLFLGRSTYSWLGPYLGLILIPMVGHAIVRHRLMDLRPILVRSLAYFAVMISASAALIAVAHLTLPDWLMSTITVAPELLIAAVVALVMVSTPAQRLLARLIEPYLYRRRLDRATALREAMQRFARLMQPRELADELSEALHRAFVPEWFLMAAWSPDDRTFESLSEPPATTAQAAAINASASAFSSGCDRSTVIVSSGRATSPTAAQLAHTLGADLLIVLARRKRLLGLVFLGPRRSGDPFYAEDLALIEALADLVSIALENSLLYRQQIETRAYSERLIEAIDSAVVAVDQVGRITSHNRAASELLGITETAVGEFVDVLPSELAWALAFSASGASQFHHVEIAITNRTGRTSPVMLSTAALHRDISSISGAIAVVTELSTVKALERNQRRVERLSRMARFYAGLAHEIRNPLASISNLISMLPDRFDDPEYRDTAVRLLPNEVARIVALADRVRFMAPSDGGSLRLVDVRPLLTDLVAIHSARTKQLPAGISLELDPELPHIIGDPNQLMQLFVNLLLNAVESMSESDGAVTIRAFARHNSTGQSLTVRVIDEGSGIDPALRFKVFEPFFTTKADGTGLGLSICYEIAEFHGATLRLTPRRDHYGTIAEVTFPTPPSWQFSTGAFERAIDDRLLSHQW
jgi:signal transduction histidine kinase/nucleotide-binding universal stress UspA family protein